jgi:hypothetical protein
MKDHGGDRMTGLVRSEPLRVRGLHGSASQMVPVHEVGREQADIATANTTGLMTSSRRRRSTEVRANPFPPESPQSSGAVQRFYW